MKIIVILFGVVCLTLANEGKLPEVSSDCSDWPSHLKSVRECCALPYNSASYTLEHCYSTCSHSNKDETENSINDHLECASKCFINQTHLITNGVIDQIRVKNFYASNNFNTQHMKNVDHALKACDYDEASPSTHENLAKYFACIENYFAENCLNFRHSPECDKTQEYFEKCHPMEFDCERWPSDLIHPKYCCNIPPLISSSARSKCNYECHARELFAVRRMKCVDECLHEDTKWKIDGKIDYEGVKEMLEANAGDEKWNKVIESAVLSCQKIFEEYSATFNESRQIHHHFHHHHRHHHYESNTELMLLENCLRQAMGDECVDIKSDHFCRKVKKFVQNCPNTKPEKHAFVHHHGHRYHSISH